MKRSIHLSCIVMFALSCAAIEAKPVSEKAARNVAVNHVNRNAQVKALGQWRKGIAPGQSRRLSAGDVAQTYAISKGGIVVYYVFNLAPGGWTIISADDVAHPVIGYCDTGAYDPNTLRQPPAFTAWMDGVAAQIADAAAQGFAPLAQTTAAWKQLNVAPADFAPELNELALAQSVSPLIQSTWGQGSQIPCCPFCWRLDDYNAYCPWDGAGCRVVCPTGCVATAMAQVMKYWQWPPRGVGYHGYNPVNHCTLDCSSWGWRDVNFSDRTYDWSNSSMPLDEPSYAIAGLMYDLGVALEMEYALDSSGSSISNAQYAFQTYLGYSAGSVRSRAAYPADLDWSNILRAELDAGRPIYYRGEGPDGGHAFVCDGYDYWGYFHFNWGWNGDNNGWFSLNDLTPGLFNEHNFTQDQAAIIGLAPVKYFYVDDGYSEDGFNDGHVWGLDAYNNIQAAIDHMHSDGVIFVSGGTYFESIDFGGKAIHLYAPEGPDRTLIEAYGALHVISCVSGEGPDTIIEGFGIRGGRATGSTILDGCGGGLFCCYSMPTVINCIFNDNIAALDGGGIFSNGHSTLINCAFYCNTAGRNGGGLMNDLGELNMVNCIFADNAATYGGGCYSSMSGQVKNCTFAGNIALASGGGIYNHYGNISIDNSILWGNTVDQIGNDNSCVVQYSDVQGGWSGLGNIDVDPRFASPGDGDYSLISASPCLDAGSNLSVGEDVTVDYGGLPRFVDACRPDTGSGTPPIVDMGACEYQHTWTSVVNCITNPGFETGNASGWFTDGGFDLVPVTEQVHSGMVSGLASNRTETWHGAWQSLFTRMWDGTYHISGWVRLQNAASDYVELTLRYRDRAGLHYRTVDSATVHNNGWTFLDGTANVAIDWQLFELDLYFHGPAAGVSFYVDDVSVTMVMGDLDKNAAVNLLDFDLFARYYGVDCATGDCGPANIEDCDATVNEHDLALFVADWLTGV